MTWKRDLRRENIRQIGDYVIYSETRNQETCHVIVLSDGRELRVLPDERSGRKRSNLVRQAVSHLASVLSANTSISEETYLLGLLLQSGFTKWEWETEDESIEEWLTNWLVAVPMLSPDRAMAAADDLIDDLAADGWEIVRGEE